MKPTLLILAAGMGSRYGGLKQLDEVGPNGETLMDYSVFDAIRAGFGKLVFVVRAGFEEAFQEKVAKKFRDRISVEYVYQELSMLPDTFTLPPQRKKPWGTGHAVLVAASAIKEPFAAINADDFYGATSFKLLSEFLAQDQNPTIREYSMVGYVLRNTLSDHGRVARGVCDLSGDYLRNVVELTTIEKEANGAKYTDATGQTHTLSGDEIVSLNVWGFTPSIFDHLKQQFERFLQNHIESENAEFYISAVVGTLASQGQIKVKVLPSRDSWFGMTYRQDKPQVKKAIQALISQGVYPESLWS